MFPCWPDSKKPLGELVPRGFHNATTDAATIDAWWAAYPDANIAFCPHEVGLAVVDIDGGQEGVDNWMALQDEHGEVPSTYAVETPRGGLHLYYRGEVPPSVGILAPHIDTRGRGSYALLPPSRVGGKPYRPLNDLTPCDLPGFVPTILAANKREGVKAAADVELDQRLNVDRATAFLQRAEPVVQGQMADSKTFIVACKVMEFGVSPEKAIELMLEHWAPRCIPCDERMPAFIERKVQNAASYSQNEAGAWAVAPAGETFDPAVLGKLLEESKAQPAQHNTKRFRFQTLEERANLPPPSWLIQDMIPDKAVTMMFGPGGGGKTFVALRLGLDLAKTGRRVAYVMGEGGTGPDQRVKAWRTLTDTPGSIPFTIVDEMPQAVDEAGMIEFSQAAAEFKPDLLILDTFAWFALGVKENDASEMMKAVRALTTLAREQGCAVLVIHHTGKDASRGARGSDALLFGINAALEVQSDMQGSKVDTMAVYARRMKDSAPRPAPWCYEVKDIGGSAVAIPISPSERRERTSRDDLITPARVGQALRDMGAIGEANGVTAHTLAVQVLQHGANAPDDPEVLMEKAVGLSRLLERRAKGNLAGYAYGADELTRFALPSGSPAP